MKREDKIVANKLIKLASGFMAQPYDDDKVMIFNPINDYQEVVELNHQCETYLELLADLWGEAERLDAMGMSPIWREGLMLSPIFAHFDVVNSEANIISMPKSLKSNLIEPDPVEEEKPQIELVEEDTEVVEIDDIDWESIPTPSPEDPSPELKEDEEDFIIDSEPIEQKRGITPSSLGYVCGWGFY